MGKALGLLINMIAALGPAASMAGFCKSVYLAEQAFGLEDFTADEISYFPKDSNGMIDHVKNRVESVRTESRRAGLIHLKRIEPEWTSVYAPDQVNYAGDPRWFSVIAGSEVSLFFGIRKISQTEMTAPTADFANVQIDLLNRQLVESEKIPVRFLETGSEPFEGRAYLRAFLRDGSLPLAKEGHYYIHDMAYHFSSLFLPPALVKAFQQRTRLLLELESRALEPTLKMALAERLRYQEGFLDGGSGFFGYFLAYESVAGRTLDPKAIADFGVRPFGKSGTSAYSQVKQALEDQMSSLEKEAIPLQKGIQEMNTLLDLLSKPEDRVVFEYSVDQYRQESLARIRLLQSLFAAD